MREGEGEEERERKGRGEGENTSTCKKGVQRNSVTMRDAHLPIAVHTNKSVSCEHLDEGTELLELQHLRPCLLAVVDGHLVGGEGGRKGEGEGEEGGILHSL